MKNVLEVGKWVTFDEDTKPFKVMAISLRYAIVSRAINRRHDAALVKYQVESGAYSSFTEAWNVLKFSSVYSILDFNENVRGKSNMVFNDTDYFDKSSCMDLISDLENGQCEISHRGRCSINITEIFPQ